MNISDVHIAYSKEFLKHASTERHPECPERIIPALDWLAQSDQAFVSISPVAAEDSYLGLVHSPQMLELFRTIQGETGWLDADTYYTPHSERVARLAAGTCAEMAKQIWLGKFRRGFALVRPPGHHATINRSMGFCLLNNIAIASAALRIEKKDIRVAILDFDLHHGNGTQERFYEDPNVLFVSSHRFPYYPGTGALEEIGRSKGKGSTLNFPLPERYGDKLFLSLYRNIVHPAVSEFSPDMILVSAGFDGHQLDPMQGFRMSSSCYGRLAEFLIHLAETHCEGKILFCLEGGYHPGALLASVQAVVEQLIRVPRNRRDLIATDTQYNSAILDEFVVHTQQFFPTV